MFESNQSNINVVPLQRFSALNEVEAYWEALREGRDMPSRAEVDPRGIQQALSHSFILERAAPGMARFRIAGSVISNLMGMEVRGMPVSSMIAFDSRDEFRSVLEDVFAGPATGRLTFYSDAGYGRGQLEAQMILLPLRSDLGDVTRILGCVAWRGDIGRAPRRLTLQSSLLRPITHQTSKPEMQTKTLDPIFRHNAHELVSSDGELLERPAIKVATQTTNLTTSRTRQTATRVPHLRLIVNDD